MLIRPNGNVSQTSPTIFERYDSGYVEFQMLLY